MSEHQAEIVWNRESSEFTYASYNRNHDWTFDAGVTVRASASPDFKGDASCIDPEEAFVASIASCHMLSFLAVACKRRFVVDAYRDGAVGILAKNEDGRLAVTKVTLRPEVTFGGELRPSPEDLRKLHDEAHHSCFIANSVRCEIVVEPG